MGKALYRKYRPKKLAEVVGQEHITDTLKQAFSKGMISHAYLLTGPRGVGKTSIARIIAYEVNGLPYDEETTHLDIIEIDAASNRRIDEIRELKERVHVAPTSARYKVYIIDEVHMLTKEAFNALLKTLEEPPEHAIFILATTEAHKVPDTIVSRTQRFTFKPVTVDKVVEHLKHIAAKEKVHITDEALRLIAAHGEGSFRDSISLFDQIRHVADELSVEHVQHALGLASPQLLDNMLAAAMSHDVTQLAAGLAELRHHGIQSTSAAQQLCALLKQRLVNSTDNNEAYVTMKLMKELLAVPTSSNTELAFELALYQTALDGAPAQPTPPTPAPQPRIKATETKTKTAPEPDKPKPPAIPVATASMDPLDSETWQAVLAAIKAQYNTLYSIARMAQPAFEPGKIKLHFAFAFHKKRFDDSKNRQILLDIIRNVTDQQLELECFLQEQPSQPASEITPPAESVNLETISNIFGGAEIVE